MGNFLFSPLIHKNNWDIQFVKHRFDVNTSTFPQRLLPNQMLGQLRGDWRAKKYIWLLLRSIYIRKKGSTSTVTLTLRVFIFALLSYSSRCRNRWSGFKWSDKNSLFKMGIRENLKLCAITWSVTFKYSVSYDDICTYSKVQISNGTIWIWCFSKPALFPTYMFKQRIACYCYKWQVFEALIFLWYHFSIRANPFHRFCPFDFSWILGYM